MKVQLTRLLPRRFRLACALRDLWPVFELLCTLPRMADAESEQLHGLPMHGRIQARKRRQAFASLEPHYVTTALFHKLRRSKRRGNVYAHAAVLALWQALEAEGVAASAPKWMQAEFGVDVGVSSNEWVTVRWPM